MKKLSKKETIRISKFLSLVLRHRPEAIGVHMDEEGWVEVDELIQKTNSHGIPLTRERLEEVVEKNDKKRFTLSDGERIRANQGHSIEVDLGLSPTRPPSVLYHGTARRFLSLIMKSGLTPGRRNHVHLSPDEESALRVGRRHGSPAILKIDAQAMERRGIPFYLSENGVWLTARVPKDFIEFPSACRSDLSPFA